MKYGFLLLLLVSSLAHSSTLKMEVVRSSKTMKDFLPNAHGVYSPEDRPLNSHLCENLIPNKPMVFSLSTKIQ
jgi:hypothetical protein